MINHNALKALEPLGMAEGLKHAQSLIGAITTGCDSTWDEERQARDAIPKRVDANRASLEKMEVSVDGSF